MTMKGTEAGSACHSLEERVIVDPKWNRMSKSVRRSRISRMAAGAFSGRVIDNRGYARIKMGCHPRRMIQTGYVYEHIVAAEMCLGRPLEPGEIVHHDDGDKTNSHYSNLVVFPSQGAHAKYHAAVRRGLKDSRASTKLFGAILCERPSLPSGGPHWIQALKQRITG